MKKIILFFVLIVPFNVKALSASSYVIMDTDNNRVLEGNNINSKSLIASITKIMTSMVVINNVDINKKIIVGEEILKSYGSGIYISIGEEITYKDLLYGLMMRSGNDAAITLAYNVGGSMEGFAYMMNNLAFSLNMKNTSFVNSNGLEEKDSANYSTAYDMALLSSYAINNSTYKKIVGTKKRIVKTNLKTYDWTNKNKLLNYKYCTGGKTGFTKLAHRTLVTNASKNKVNLTVVTLNDGNDFKDHQNLYEKYFKVLKNYNIIKKGPIKTKYSNTYHNNSFKMALTRDEYQNIKIAINYYEDNATNIVGKIEVELNGKTYFSDDIYQKKSTKKLSFWQKIKRKFSFLW